MNKKRLNNILPNLLMIVIIIVTFYIYRKYDYNYFSKGILENGRTEFSRDSNVKYSKDRSYKIENKVSNDAMFYREVTVRKNTPYRVTCMVRTENVVGNENDTMAGAQICLKKHMNIQM
ncbi:MAG: hypothetical protein ACLU2J_04770 [Clostridia bacterium]